VIKGENNSWWLECFTSYGENKKTAFLEIIVIEETHVTLFISPPRRERQQQAEGRFHSMPTVRDCAGVQCTTRYIFYPPPPPLLLVATLLEFGISSMTDGIEILDSR